MFSGLSNGVEIHEPIPPLIPIPNSGQINKLLDKLRSCSKPVIIVGSQVVLDTEKVFAYQKALEHIGVPCFLSGMSRGLLGSSNLQMRHHRREALKATDLCILLGAQMDFRLSYGQNINYRSYLVTVNRSKEDLTKNRKPNLAILGDPGLFLLELANIVPENLNENWKEWYGELRDRDEKRNLDIIKQSQVELEQYINPIYLCSEIDKVLGEKSILIGDGGDFVGTASYIIRPRGPLNWLDPGPFGTLGVGYGFAEAAKLSNPDHEVWILFGDCSCAFSFMEIDTCRRHNLPIIAVIGNDACCTQIWREQVRILEDDVGCMLDYSDYHLAGEGLGAKGFLIERNEDVPSILAKAKEEYAKGFSVVINAKIGKTDFRKGSLSL